MQPRLYTHFYQSEQSTHPLDQSEASKFTEPKRREEFLFGRYWLRFYLSELAPEWKEAKIERRDSGKPFIQNCPWHFNLSHSRGALLVGFHQQPIGVDLEFNPKLPKHSADILKRFFPQQYLNTFDSLSDETREIFFFKLWVAYEAQIKFKASSILEPVKKSDWPAIAIDFKNLDLGGELKIEIISANSKTFSAVCHRNQVT